MTLEQLLEECTGVIEAENIQTLDNYGKFFFMELSPNIRTYGLIQDIGKVSEWRASLFYGSSLDHIDYQDNYFGSTPFEACKLLHISLCQGRAQCE